MTNNELQNPFRYGFFTKKHNDLFYIMYVNPVLSNTAQFSMQDNLPDFINPNLDLPAVNNFNYNSETSSFTSDIGDGKFVLDEKGQIKVIFSNFKYNEIPNLELDFNIKLNTDMGEDPNAGLKI